MKNPQDATRNRDVAPLRRRIEKLEAGAKTDRKAIQNLLTRVTNLEKKLKN